MAPLVSAGLPPEPCTHCESGPTRLLAFLSTTLCCMLGICVCFAKDCLPSLRFLLFSSSRFIIPPQPRDQLKLLAESLSLRFFSVGTHLLSFPPLSLSPFHPNARVLLSRHLNRCIPFHWLDDHGIKPAQRRRREDEEDDPSARPEGESPYLPTINPKKKALTGVCPYCSSHYKFSTKSPIPHPFLIFQDRSIFFFFGIITQQKLIIYPWHCLNQATTSSLMGQYYVRLTIWWNFLLPIELA